MALNIAFISAASAVQRYLPHSRGQTSVGACMLWFETIGAPSLRDVALHTPNTLPKQQLIGSALLSALSIWPRSFPRHILRLLQHA